MAQLLFKRGLHANLPTQAIDGAFYLTTDSHRLYAGIDGKLVDLNKYIHTVPNLEALTDSDKNNTAKAGDFYYIIDKNVLCVRMENGSWQQINKNTDTTNSSLEVTGENNAVKMVVTDSEGGTVEDTIAFAGAKGTAVTVAEGDGTVTVTGTTYSLGDELATETGIYTITLTPDGTSTTATSVKLAAGSNVQFAMNGDRLEISATDTYVTSEGSSVTLNNTGDISVVIKDTAGNDATVSQTGALYYTVNGETIYNQNALPVYNKTQIDEMFNGLNPMSYKGPINGEGDLNAAATEGVKIGDTYMVATADTYKGHAAKIGDLFIAAAKPGKTETNGVLAAADIEWTYIPAGDDSQKDTLYYGAATASQHLLNIKDSDGSVVASHKLIADATNGKIELSSKAVAQNGVNAAGLEVTVKHAEITPIVDPKNVSDDANQVVAIEAVTVDSTGHVTSYKTRTYNIEGYALEQTAVAVANNVGTVTGALKSSGGDAAGSVAFGIDCSADDNLKIEANGANLKLSVEWGTF